MTKGRKKKSREPIIAGSVFIIGIIVEMIKYFTQSRIIDENLLLIYPIGIIIFSLLFSLTYIDGWKESITHTLVGFTLYFGITYAFVLFGVQGLGSTSTDVIEGLSRISFALISIWKLHSDMRYIDLTLKPGQTKSMNRRELYRLVKIVSYVILTFYFLNTGLELIKHDNVNPTFLKKTEDISSSILFVGLQSPLLMASRSSVSRTFSNYLDNYSELITRYSHNLQQLNTALSTYLNVKTLSYSQINNNGKTMWMSIIVILFLQVYKAAMISLLGKIDILGFWSTIEQFLPL